MKTSEKPTKGGFFRSPVLPLVTVFRDGGHRLVMRRRGGRAIEGDTKLEGDKTMRKRCLAVGSFLLFACASTLAPSDVPTTAAAAQASDQHPAYLDASLPVERRVDDLISRMTLDEKVAQMQYDAPGIQRLGVPPYNWWSEALHGVARAGAATVFPQAIGLAATWDAPLIHRVADVISTEARAKYNDAVQHENYGQNFGLTFWSPNINIFRDPRWGRGQET